MFKSKTLFVVGAGASAEVGLPTGAQLKSIISNAIDIRLDDWGDRQVSGDVRIKDAFREHVRETDPQNQDIMPYLEIAWQIRDAMPQAISIDNFLDAHRNPMMELCGKLAIAKAILDAERESKLYIKSPKETSIKHEIVNDTWYSAFFQLLTENVRKEDLDKIFNNVSFIAFNYDRCIEHFLSHAIKN